MADDDPVQIFDPPPMALQLTAAATLTSLPPQVMTEPPQTIMPTAAISSTTPAPATEYVVNTNPPALDANDTLLFDPDELTNYDVLGPTPNLDPLPIDTARAPAPQLPLGSSSGPRDVGMVVDMESKNATPTETGDGNGMGWKFWVGLVTILVVCSMMLLLYVTSGGGGVISSSQGMGGAPGMDYGMGGGGGVGGGGGGGGYGGPAGDMGYSGGFGGGGSGMGGPGY